MRKFFKILLYIATLVSLAVADAGKCNEIALGKINKKSLNFDISMIDDAETVFVLRQISQPLVDYNSNGQIVPSVAKYWTVSKDMKTYLFYLRKGMKFSNGRSLTSKDVVSSLDLIKASYYNPLHIYFDKILKIEAISDEIVRIQLSIPWSGFLHCIASGLAPVFSAEEYENGKSFLGSGPYKLILDDTKYYLVKNPFYVGFYSPVVPRFRILTEMDTAIPDIALNNFEQLIQDSSYSKREVDSFSGSYLMINPKQERWKNRKARLALMRTLIASKKSFFGAGRTELKDVFPKGMPGFDIKHSAYDILLSQTSEVDFADIRGTKIVIGSPAAIPRFEDLKKRYKIRYEVELVNLVTDVRHALPEMAKSSSIDIFAFGWNSIFSHPDASLTPFHILGFQDLDPRVGKLNDEIMVVEDQVRQYFLYRKLSALLIENGYILPLGQKKLSVLTKKHVSISKYRYRYTLQLSEITEER